MEVKNTVKALVVLAVLVSLSGCGFLLGVVLGDDVGVVNVVADDSGTNGIESVTITFASYSSNPDDVPYAIVLSNGQSLSYYSDVVIYEGEVDLQLSQTTTVIVTRSEIDAHLTLTGESAATGDYYVGVIMDPMDTLDDTDPSDNQGVSSSQYYYQ